MTNNHHDGAASPRVVLHRHGGLGSYAVAVVADEGPYSKEEAEAVADTLRESSGWVTKARAAERLGLSTQMVDNLRRAGLLSSVKDAAGHVMITRESIDREIARRSA